MKTWRNQRETARRRYTDTAYPGDLADDLGFTASAASRFKIERALAAVAAAAIAATAVWWGLQPPATSDPTPPLATAPVDPPVAPPVEVTTHDTTRPPVSVRLSETPALRENRAFDGRSRLTPPGRPRSLGLGTTPRRFPGVNRQAADSPPPSSRSPHHDDPFAPLT